MADAISIGKDHSVKSYRCKKGHTWQCTPVGVSFAYYPLWDEKGERVPIVDSGPLCPYCIVVALKDNFGGMEVGEEPENGVAEEDRHG